MYKPARIDVSENAVSNVQSNEQKCMDIPIIEDRFSLLKDWGLNIKVPLMLHPRPAIAHQIQKWNVRGFLVSIGTAAASHPLGGTFSNSGLNAKTWTSLHSRKPIGSKRANGWLLTTTPFTAEGVIPERVSWAWSPRPPVPCMIYHGRRWCLAGWCIFVFMETIVILILSTSINISMHMNASKTGPTFGMHFRQWSLPVPNVIIWRFWGTGTLPCGDNPLQLGWTRTSCMMNAVRAPSIQMNISCTISSLILTWLCSILGMQHWDQLTFSGNNHQGSILWFVADVTVTPHPSTFNISMISPWTVLRERITYHSLWHCSRFGILIQENLKLDGPERKGLNSTNSGLAIPTLPNNNNAKSETLLNFFPQQAIDWNCCTMLWTLLKAGASVQVWHHTLPTFSGAQQTSTRTTTSLLGEHVQGLASCHTTTTSETNDA